MQPKSSGRKNEKLLRRRRGCAAPKPVRKWFDQMERPVRSAPGINRITVTRLPEILRRQLDRRAMRRAVGGVIPGVAVAVQDISRRDALGGNQAFECGQPMPVIG